MPALNSLRAPLLALACASLSLTAQAAPRPVAPEKTRVDALLPKIDAVADKLKGTENFTSPIEWRKSSAAIGLPGLDLPKSVGGQGYSAAEVAKVLEHMGTYSLDMRDMVGGAHARLLLKSDAPEVRKIVSNVAKGKAYVAIAITEKEAGSDVKAMKSVAVKDGDDYVLTGEKMFNARLETATHVILFARTGNKLNAFVVPTDYPGLELKSISAHGLYGNSFGGVAFDHVRIPAKYRLGGEGEGSKLFNDHFTYWRLLQAAAAVGTGEGALTQAVDRMKSRLVFGRPIGAFTHLQQELAKHTANLHAATLMIDDAARKIDKGDYEGAAPYVAMVKAEGVEWALGAADFAMRVFGAEGYSPDLTDLGQRVRDLQGLRIADGTTDVMRSQVVRGLWGDDLWSLATGEATGKANEPRKAFERLRDGVAKAPDKNGKLLAEQDDYDDLVKDNGGGACPTVAAANLIQGLGAMGGQEPFDIDRAIKAVYKAKPDLRDGRLTNDQVVDVLAFYQKQFVPDVKMTTRVDYVRALVPAEQPEGARGWSDLDSSLLQTHPNELKLVSYTVEEGGSVLGRHFVILKQRTGETLSVIDPNKPLKDYQYDMSRVDLPNQAGSSIQLTRPAQVTPSTNRFTINSIVTVTLTPETTVSKEQ